MIDTLWPYLFQIIAGSYLFAAGAYLFGWRILMLLYDVRTLVTNHQVHRFEDIETRLDRLEDE